METPAYARALAKALGPGIVHVDESTRTEHAKDKWFASRVPDVVVMARSRARGSKRAPRWAGRSATVGSRRTPTATSASR